MNVYRTFWQYLWSGVGLGYFLAGFIVFGIISVFDFPPALYFFGPCFVIALVCGILDYRKNG